MNLREISGFVVIYASAFICIGALVIAGCADATLSSTEPAELPSSYLLDVEPDGALDVAEAKAAIAVDPEVVLIGRISAGDADPWEAGRAAFVVTDAATLMMIDDDPGAHGEDCNCHFCNRDKSANDSLAVVKIVNEQGEVVAVDARDLLGIKQNQIVVVRGHGSIDALGNLTVAARGVYVRR